MSIQNRKNNQIRHILCDFHSLKNGNQRKMCNFAPVLRNKRHHNLVNIEIVYSNKYGETTKHPHESRQKAHLDSQS